MAKTKKTTTEKPVKKTTTEKPVNVSEFNAKTCSDNKAAKRQIDNLFEIIESVTDKIKKERYKESVVPYLNQYNNDLNVRTNEASLFKAASIFNIINQEN